MRDNIFTELGTYDAVAPIEVNVRDLESKYSPVLVDIEYSFVEEAGETFKAGRETLDYGGKVLEKVNGI